MLVKKDGFAIDLNLRSLGFSRALFGISAAGLALLSLVYGNFAPILAPPPASLPWEVCTYASGVILLAASAGLLVARAAPLDAIVLAVYGSICYAGNNAHPQPPR